MHTDILINAPVSTCISHKENIITVHEPLSLAKIPICVHQNYMCCISLSFFFFLVNSFFNCDIFWTENYYYSFWFIAVRDSITSCIHMSYLWLFVIYLQDFSSIIPKSWHDKSAHKFFQISCSCQTRLYIQNLNSQHCEMNQSAWSGNGPLSSDLLWPLT